MRIAMAIFLGALAGGCAPLSVMQPDFVYPQEVADRYQGGDPPPGAPREYTLDLQSDPLWGETRWHDLQSAPLPFRPILGEVWVGEAAEPQGWAGGSQGLIRRITGGWRYYAGKRWLPDDKVTGLAPDGSGGVWARTETGYSHIHSIPMALEDKAKLFEERVRARHLRHGLVASCRLARPGDLTSAVTESSDNDGLWTAMYVAAEAFRYAATKSEEARRFAWESYRAIERLQTISGVPGFPARSFIESGKPTGGGEWHPTADGKWFWKGDTSSDELDGHFFVAGVYYDLVADEEEKESIRKNVGAIMDHLIDHGYTLVDLDGKPTTWGVWAPEKLNDDRSWWRERGLNSLEVLSYLATTEHITGNPRYRAAARDLIGKHGYAENTVKQRINEPPEEVNYSDDELAFLSYYNLLRYEADRRLRATYERSLRRTFQAVAPEWNPLWIFISAAGGAIRLRHKPWEWPIDLMAIGALQDTPLDMVEWRMVNSHRKDLKLAPHVNRFGHPVALRPLHPAERGALKYNSDPYRLDDGGDGSSEDDGSFFLLSYWMGRHHGFIGPPQR